MKSNIEWELWGRSDPLYGVASWAGRERDGANPWTDDEFYALGEDWHDYESAWRRMANYCPGTVLEIGSGAGRMTRMLAGAFDQVIATDISTEMLTYARSRVTATNISWKVSDGDRIPADDCELDAIFSCHVFQHFPNNASQLSIFKEMNRVLKRGGTFFVHLPIHEFPVVNRSFSRLAAVSYRMFLHLSGARAAVERKLIRAGIRRTYMHGVSYELQPLFDSLSAIGFTELSMLGLRVRTSPGIHTCISGRAPL